MELLFSLFMIVLLLALGYSFGGFHERRHFLSLKIREAKLRLITVYTTKRLPTDLPVQESFLVTGSAVISVDYFKTFWAGLTRIVGGPMTSYQSLLERARREALCRLKAEAARKGATAIYNVRFVTANIAGQQVENKGIRAIETLAYGTAIRVS